MRLLGLCVLAAALAACGSEGNGPFSPADTGVAADVPADTAADAGADSGRDAAPDATPMDVATDTDASTDAGRDAAVDTSAVDTSAVDTVFVDTVFVDTARVDTGVGPDGGTVGRTCGGFAGLRCSPGEFCEYDPSAMCGRADATGTCSRIPEACPPVVMQVCGCDGRTYSSPCDASRAGVSVERTGACGATMCAPQEARGEGACGRFLGYFWDGTDCRGQSGCSCVGADCGGGYDSPEACRAAYSACTPTTEDCRTRGCPSGQRCEPCRGPSGLVYACIPEGASC